LNCIKCSPEDCKKSRLLQHLTIQITEQQDGTTEKTVTKALSRSLLISPSAPHAKIPSA
jgi:hypothetical protein